MRNVCCKKGLVVGIIVLFICLIVQPSMGTVIPEKIEVKPNKYLIQTIIAITNNQDVKDYFKKLNFDSIDFDIMSNPGIFEDLNYIITNNEDLSNRILTIESINEDTYICDFLESLYNKYGDRIANLYDIFEMLGYYNPLLQVLFYPLYLGIGSIYLYIIFFVEYIAMIIECEWAPPPPIISKSTL